MTGTGASPAPRHGGAPVSRQFPFATPGSLSRIVNAAAAAPSVHNTQPWRFRRVDDATMELYADLDRLLAFTDPAGRGMGISCGAALFNLRLAIRMTGHDTRVTAVPDPGERPDLLAALHATPCDPPDADERLLYSMIPQRRTNRFPFDGRRLPREVFVDLVVAAYAENTTLVLITGETARRMLGMIGVADATLAAEEPYLAELARWTHSGNRCDGVPEQSFGPRPRNGTLPIRDFGLGSGRRHGHDPGTEPHRTGEGARPSAAFEADPQLAALFTSGDGPRDWLRAGQALQRVLLTATRHGVAVSMFSQPIDLRATHHRNHREGPFGHLQMLLRVGYGPPAPQVPRRSVFEVLDPVETLRG